MRYKHFVVNSHDVHVTFTSIYIYIYMERREGIHIKKGIHGEKGEYSLMYVPYFATECE